MESAFSADQPFKIHNSSLDSESSTCLESSFSGHHAFPRIEQCLPTIWINVINIRDALEKFLRGYLGIFPNIEGEGLLNSQNFCKLTKRF